MKLTATTALLAAVVALSASSGDVAASSGLHLRHNSNDNNEATAAAASCLGAKSKEDCWATTDGDGATCVWCVAGAIPSECVSAEQADSLPPAVFTCESPNSYRSIKPNPNSKSNSGEGLIAAYTFDMEVVDVNDSSDSETVTSDSDASTETTPTIISLTTNHHDVGDDERDREGDDAGPGTDFDAIRRGYISVTPIHVDLTRYQALDQVSGWVSGIDTGQALREDSA